MPKFSHCREHRILEIFFVPDSSLVFELERCSVRIRDHLALHGAVQMVGAQVTHAKHTENKYELALDAIHNLSEAFPKKTKRPLSLMATAIAKVRERPDEKVHELFEKLRGLDQNDLDKLIAHPEVAAAAESIWWEREAEEAKQPQQKKTRRVPEINVAQRSATLLYSNSRTLRIELARANDVDALGLYGAKQKIADSYAGINDVLAQEAAAREIIQSLYDGSWTPRAKQKEFTAGPTTVTTNLSEYIVGSMNWPNERVLAAVGMLSEDEQMRLLEPRARQILIQHSRMLRGPETLSVREISDLLDDVIDSLDLPEKEEPCSVR